MQTRRPHQKRQLARRPRLRRPLRIRGQKPRKAHRHPRGRMQPLLRRGRQFQSHIHRHPRPVRPPRQPGCRAALSGCLPRPTLPRGPGNQKTIRRTMRSFRHRRIPHQNLQRSGRQLPAHRRQSRLPPRPCRDCVPVRARNPPFFLRRQKFFPRAKTLRSNYSSLRRIRPHGKGSLKPCFPLSGCLYSFKPSPKP